MPADLGPDGGAPPAFTRDFVLGGMPARRASTLLFAIENRAALMAARARRAMASYETEHTVAERERAFLGALADGRTPPLKPTLQDIDRHAREWRDLVPTDAELRAAVLARIEAKYGLPPQAASVAASLGASEPAVAAAFKRQTGHLLSDARKARPLSRRERMRWFRDALSRRVEALPPFWLAFALTLTETVGVGVLALPIAFASFGVAGATLMLVVFAALNVVTVAALAEAITRTGHMRYGHAFFGRLVGDYLGRPGNLVAMPALFLLEASGMIVCLIGFGTTIGAITGIPAVLCAAALFAAVGVIMWRDSLNLTVAVAVGLGFVNLALVIVMSLVALASPAADVGPLAGQGEGVAVLELIFGVGLGAYFGHTSAGHSAKVVLARDVGGRQFLAGNVAAMVTALVIYVLFVVGVTNAVGAAQLIGFDGTAITPLAERVGPVIDVMGTIYIVLTLGLGAMFVGLGLYNQMGEMLYGLGSVGTRVHHATRPVQFAVRSAPTLALFGIVVVLLQGEAISLTEILAVMGTLTVPLLGGVFPMLLLVAARRRGERVPAVGLGILGSPALAGAVGVIFLLGVAAFGLWIWTDPVQRVLALGVSAAILLLVVVSGWRGAFRPRTIVEYRVEAAPPPFGTLSLVSAGRVIAGTIRVRQGTRSRTVPTAVEVPDPDTLTAVEVDIPPDVAPELLVWVHRVGADGTSAPSPVPVGISIGDEPLVPLGGTTDRVMVPPGEGPTELTLSMSPAGAGQ